MKRKLEVIFIDDEPEILEVYNDLKIGLEHNIKCFESPSKAITYINSNASKILCIVSDYRMSEMNGLELRQSIFETHSMIPFLIITAFKNEKMLEAAMGLNVSAFLTKPYNGTEVVDSIKNFSKPRLLFLEEEYETLISFIEESTPMVSELEDIILTLEEDPSDHEAITTFMRILHTIKGTAACVGMEVLAKYAHYFEDFVVTLDKRSSPITEKNIEMFLSGIDQIKQTYSSISETGEYDIDCNAWQEIFQKELSDEEVIDEDVKKVKESESANKEILETTQKKKEVEEKISVNLSILDEFMKQSGELTVLRNTVFKLVDKLSRKYTGERDLSNLGEFVEEMNKVTSQLQSEIQEMRKVDIGNVFRPLKRIVRDVAKSSGKDVQFDSMNDDNRIDNTIAKVLNNCLVHMIRNAVDHGIEGPEERISKGKTGKGYLKIDNYERDGHIFIEIEDNGRGIDPKVIREKALEKELYLESELAQMTDKRVFAIIFEAGFSTAAEVTDISGRGVGMDMVKTSIEQMGGRIIIDSELGKGTKFVLKIPLPRSVLIIRSLMIQTSNMQFAIPADDILEVLLIEKSRESRTSIHCIKEKYFLEHQGDLVPVVDLANCLKLKLGEQDRILNNESEFVIVGKEDEKFAIYVDEILDFEEVVVKDLSPQIKKEVIYSGAAFVGDGEVALILDILGLAHSNSINLELDLDSDHINNNGTEVFEETDFVVFSVGEKDSEQEFCIPVDQVVRLENFGNFEIEKSGTRSLIRYNDQVLAIVYLEHALMEKHRSLDKIGEVDELNNLIIVKKKNELIGFAVNSIKNIITTQNEVDCSFISKKEFMGTIELNGKTCTIIDLYYILEHYHEALKVKNSLNFAA